MDKNEKLVEIFENEQFKAAAEEITTAGELQALFAEYGLELTLDEINELCAVAALRMNSGELNETELEDVSGGASSALRAVGSVIKWLIKTGPRTLGPIILPVQPRKPSVKR